MSNNSDTDNSDSNTMTIQNEHYGNPRFNRVY